MALSKDTPLAVAEGIFGALPVKASSTIYEGSLVGLAAGYARALTALDPFMGHAQRGVVGGTSDGTEKVVVRKGPYSAQVTLASVAVTDVGREVYATDDATLALGPTNASRVGIVLRYVAANTAIVQFEPCEVLDAVQGVEFDCGLAAAAAAVVLVPAWANPKGLVVESIYGVVTEAFAGATQDQGIVVVSDESNNALATLTASDTSADAVGDIIEGFFVTEVATGTAGVVVAAGEYIDAVVTQLTSGTGLTGKMRVICVVRPYKL